jgi:hypothetical protein
MSHKTLEEWLRRREPPIPGPLLPLLLEDIQCEFHELDLARRGGDRLGEAMALPGRNREAAFHLLAADSFITYACESVAQGPDTGTKLQELLELLGDRFR